MKIKSSSGKRVAKRRFFKADERFATKAVIVIAITTAAFIVAQCSFIPYHAAGTNRSDRMVFPRRRD